MADGSPSRQAAGSASAGPPLKKNSQALLVQPRHGWHAKGVAPPEPGSTLARPAATSTMLSPGCPGPASPVNTARVRPSGENAPTWRQQPEPGSGGPSANQLRAPAGGGTVRSSPVP